MVVQTVFVTVKEHAGHKGSFSRKRKLEEGRKKIQPALPAFQEAKIAAALACVSRGGSATAAG